MIPLYPIPGQYDNEQTFDVSVIVPLYKSADVIADQIRFWPREKVNHEIIYVDDCCPQKSRLTIFREWNRRADKQDFIVRLLASPQNLGFGGACNLGAHHARGRILIFLNADTTPCPHWLPPILQSFEDPQVGIVGNVQLKDGGKNHGTIDGAGSEWNWEFMNFLHIGRHTYNGEPLDEPFNWNNSPKDLHEQAEREMVTGCCLAIRKDIFQEVGGFDFHYRIGYWEDSELCLAVRSLGHKIMFQPKSIIYHKLSHSQVAKHAFAALNKNYFTNKWVTTGRIDKLVKARRFVKPTKVGRIFCKRQEARGDVLLATAVLPQIKERYPEAEIQFCTKCPEILEGNPYIDTILPTMAIPGPTHQLVFDFDLAYERRPYTNVLNAYADLVDVDVARCEPYLKTVKPDQAHLPDEPYVVIHPGRTAWVGRDWEEDGFWRISQRIREKLPVVCVGGKTDRGADCDIDLRGLLSIHETAHVIQHASYFVGIDSFPMHIAQAFNVPGVCFFGSILPKTRLYRANMVSVQAPVDCLGCHHRKPPPITGTTVCERGDRICEKMDELVMWNVIKERLRI